jgi:hypothetical protein
VASADGYALNKFLAIPIAAFFGWQNLKQRAIVQTARPRVALPLCHRATRGVESAASYALDRISNK